MTKEMNMVAEVSAPPLKTRACGQAHCVSCELRRPIPWIWTVCGKRRTNSRMSLMRSKALRSEQICTRFSWRAGRRQSGGATPNIIPRHGIEGSSIFDVLGTRYSVYEGYCSWQLPEPLPPTTSSHNMETVER